MPYDSLGMRKFRRWRLLVWSVLASLVVHALFVWLVGPLWLNRFIERAREQQPVLATISMAARIEKRPVPQHARHPTVHVQPQPVPHAQQQRVAVTQQVIPPRIIRARGTKPPPTHTLTQADLDEETRQFQKTIARAKAANNPLAGIAQSTVTPQAPKRYTFNVRSEVGGSPLPSGMLFAVSRKVVGGYAYYHVRYDVEYVDGEQESGEVPWLIRYPLDGDPFAAGIAHVPLPGPPADYVVPAGTDLPPLVKNCYDHHFEYCPIAREGD